MEKELYIFSNDPVPPVREFKESGVDSEYVTLSSYLDPKIAAAPNYSGTQEHGVEEIDRFKRDLLKNYHFVHVYKNNPKRFKPATGDYAKSSHLNEVHVYEYSHKEFNLKDERKKV